MVQKIDRGCHRRKGIGIFVLEGGRDCTNPSRILAARSDGFKNAMPQCLRRPRFFLHKWNLVPGFVENAVSQKETGTKKRRLFEVKVYNCIRIIYVM